MNGAIFPFIVVYAQNSIAALWSLGELIGLIVTLEVACAFLVLIPNQNDWVTLRYLFVNKNICDEFTTPCIRNACEADNGDLVIISVAALTVVYIVRISFYISIYNAFSRWRATLKEQKALALQPNKIVEEKKIQ